MANSCALVTEARQDERALFRYENKKYVDFILGKHSRISKYLTAFYERTRRSFGYRVANIKLKEISESLIFDSYQTSTIDDDSICNISKARAEHCKNLFEGLAVNSDVEVIKTKLEKYCSANGVAFPFVFVKKDNEEKRAAKIISAALRVSDDKWWRRQLRKVTGRCTESALRGMGAVQSGRAPYVSNYSFERWLESQKRNIKTLETMEAVSVQDGEEVIVPLAECIASSVANPTNRRNELMVRMRGYEEVATGMGFKGLFLTLTAPSKYHAISSGRGINSKFNGSSPSEVMEYLNGVWACIRAEWNRQGIKCFGFRVAEPHHDGTPHFHLMLFMGAENIEEAKEIFGFYALAEDGEEEGAEKYRWDVKEMDPEQGSACGYLAKYVAKNIDGFGVGVDEEADCVAEDGALRARAWASLWGIRQFQSIGSVSVTVYRELRRKAEAFENPEDELKALRGAADAGNWAEFVMLMGGPLVRRDEQALRPLYYEAEQFHNKYAEGVNKLIGLWLRPLGRALGRCSVVTRDCVWSIRRREPVDEEAKPPTLDLCQ